MRVVLVQLHVCKPSSNPQGPGDLTLSREELQEFSVLLGFLHVLASVWEFDC